MNTIWTPRELTVEENYALNYAVALVGGKGSMGYRVFQKATEILNQRKVSQEDRRRWLKEGLNGLLAKGIIEAKKDGEGDWQPTVIHFEKLGPDTLVNG